MNNVVSFNSQRQDNSNSNRNRNRNKSTSTSDTRRQSADLWRQLQGQRR